MGETCAFFYGTLMHPKILKRVIKNDGLHLQICPAALLGYTRHKVQNVDYPGIVPYIRGQTLINRDLNQEERSVRGTLVKGLTSEDMELLDAFEGTEYIREGVEVHPLDAPTNMSGYDVDDKSLVPSKPPALSAPSDLATAIKAETYVYCNVEDLESELWSFEDFVKNNAWKWYERSSGRQRR